MESNHDAGDSTNNMGSNPQTWSSLNSGQLTQDLLKANLASNSPSGVTGGRGGNNQQMNLQVLKSMMENNAAGNASLGGNGGLNQAQDLLNAGLAAGNPALSLALLGKDAGSFASQLARASSLTSGAGSQNDPSTMKNGSVQNMWKNQKESLPNGDASPKLSKDEASNLDLNRLKNVRLPSDMTQTFKSSAAAAAAIEALSNNNAGLEQQSNGKDSIGEVGIDNMQGINPSLAAALLENSGSGANALNLSQPYMQTLQTLLQQQQHTQQQILQLQNLQQGNPSNPEIKVPPSLSTDSSNGKREASKDRGTINTLADTYRDFSRVGDDGSDLNTSQPPGKDPPFPVKLHRILSNPEYNDVISWLPHGRSWRVLKPKAFEEKVIPLYFRHAKYASFMRQVNGWGFKRMTQGPDHNSYYHELFLRGMQHLCYKMRRPTKARVDADPDFNPDFYRLSMVAPLPTQEADSNSQSMNMNTIGNSNAMPNLQSSINIGNQSLQSLAGVGGLGGMNTNDNSFSANLLQQQLSQNNNVSAAQQLSSLPQGLGQNGENNLIGVTNGNSEVGQLESLRQRRELLVRQLQQIVTTNNPGSLPNPTMAGASVNTNGIIGTGNGANAANLQNGWGDSNNVSDLLNLSNPAQIQHMMSLGMNNPPNLGGQNFMLPNGGNFGSNASTVGLNMNNLSSNISNLGSGIGGSGGGMNQQLLMQNAGVLGSGGMSSNLGLGGLGNSNMMTQNLGAMLQANQLMAQNQLMGQANQNGNTRAPSDINNLFGDVNNSSS